MDFATPILSLLSFIFTVIFSVVAVSVGLGTFCHPGTSSKFFSTLEITSGVVTLFLHFITLLSPTYDQNSDEFYVRFQIVLTVWLIGLAIGHLLELRKALAAPLWILIVGTLNLRVLRYMWYLVTEYEANW